MVTFTCQSCNSCLKKKAVDTHLFKCKNPQLTCIDCLKDFDCHSYVGHVSCVTEDQRYGGKDFTLSNAMLKQKEWNQAISNVLSTNISVPAVKNIVVYASENPNCPRNPKKFMNFVLNNKAFRSKETVEVAFKLIQDEFNKLSSSNQENNENNQTNAAGKRKTISETEAQETDTSNSTTDKKSKKKNKDQNGETEENATISQNGSLNTKKNKKKGKRNNLENGGEEHSQPSVNGSEDVYSEETTKNGDVAKSTEGKKKKKNKKSKNNSSLELLTEDCNGISEISQHIEETEEKSSTNVEELENSVSDVSKEELSKLSKKERKKLLKQKKYEAEIVSIENYKKEEEDAVEEVEKPKKKKKKQLEDDTTRAQKISISEPEDKKIKLEVCEEEPTEEVVQVEKPKKFKWDQVIIEVLQSQSDGEMSLKRLSKKVCGEYTNVYGERESYEEVLLKFNKKVVRTQGVRVFKDKAKLLIDS